MRLTYYRESNRDYIAVAYSLPHQTDGVYEGRAAAIEGNPRSVTTTGIHRDYIRQRCKRVRKSEVPREWLVMF